MKKIENQKTVRAIQISTIEHVQTFYEEFKNESKKGIITSLEQHTLFKKNKVPYTTIKSLIKLNFITRIDVGKYEFKKDKLTTEEALKVVRYRNMLQAKNTIIRNKKSTKVVINQIKYNKPKKEKNKIEKKKSIFTKMWHLIFGK
jgi:hypothetical protein